MWLKSVTSHLIPVGTAVSAVGHRTITMYGFFGTAQSLGVQKRARSAIPEISAVKSPSTKPVVAAMALGKPLGCPKTTLTIMHPVCMRRIERTMLHRVNNLCSETLPLCCSGNRC
jgi:hypothetical protein